MKKIKRSCFVFFIKVFMLVNGQYVQSPCPGIFDYQSDGSNIYGVIRLKSTGPVSSVSLRINFTVATKLFSNYVGRIEPIGENSALQNFNNGDPLVYRVHFPVTSPLPRLTELVVNGNVLCYGQGETPRPNVYITTITLSHVLYIKSTSSNIYNQLNIQPAQDPALQQVGNYGNNGQLFTFNDIDNKVTWSTNNNKVHDSVNNIHQEYMEKPPVEQPNAQPVNDYYTYYHSEPTSQVTRPQTQVSFSSPSKPAIQQSNVPQQQQTQPQIIFQPQTPPQPQTLPQPQPLPQTQPQPQPQPAPIPIQTQPDPQIIPSTPSRLPVVNSGSTAVECGVIAGGNERVPLIYNGQSYERGDWPWLVAVYRRKEGSLTFICAGTLVSDRHVVTAAHCMHQKNKISTLKDIVVKVGVYNLEDWGDDVSVTRTLVAAEIHKSYNASTLENDVLVVTFDRKVEFSTYIRPACLWNGNADLSRIVGASGVVAGWGSSELGPSGQGEPRMVRIPIVSTAACRASKPEFHKLTSSNTLCAGDRKGSGPCNGDSGGGLYILDGGRWRLRGVVSLSLRPQNGDNSCNLNEYIVFTDTAQYLGWIRTVISQNLYD